MTYSSCRYDEVVPVTEITGLTGSRGQSQLLVEYLPQMREEREGGGKEGDSIRKRGGEGGEEERKGKWGRRGKEGGSMRNRESGEEGEKGERGKEREGGREHEVEREKGERR